MKLLFVTSDEYPFFGTTTKLINQLIFEGGLGEKNSISVLSLCNEFSQTKCELYKGVRIYRVKSYGKIGKEKYFDIVRDLSFSQKVGSFLEKLYFFLHEKGGKHPRLLREPNIYRISYVLNKMDKKKYDVIIPISGDYDTVAAVIRAKLHAKKVFWQVDPCASNWLRQINDAKKSKKLEIEIAKETDSIFTDELYYKDLIANVGDKFKRKINVIRMPLLSISEDIERRHLMPAQETRCVFCGLIYAGIRDPQYTFRVFNAIGKKTNARLHMYGVDQKDMDFGSTKNIVFHGIVPIEEASTAVWNADFLVNIGNLMTNQVPSKVFEYIATGKPIINICKNRDCPTIELLENYPNVISIFEEDDLFNNQVDAVCDFINGNKGKVVDREVIREKYKEYFPDQCAKEFELLLKQIIEK